jgi:hypothetical protein
VLNPEFIEHDAGKTQRLPGAYYFSGTPLTAVVSLGKFVLCVALLTQEVTVLPPTDDSFRAEICARVLL